MNVRFSTQSLALLLLVALLALGTVVQLALPPISDETKDIYFMYLEGQRITQGTNPYLRILGGNMRENDKYPTYLPLFYLVAALGQRLGLTDYQAWLAALRWVLLPINVGLGALLYWILYRRRGLALALACGLIWLLNRWNLRLWRLGYMDCAAILCLVLSLWLLHKRRMTALLLFSLSLALKHYGIFLVPLYLIDAWQENPERRWTATMTSGLVIASIPVMLLPPFLFWPGQSPATNASGLAHSLLFSATRDASRDIDAPSLDAIFGFSGWQARLPVLVLAGLVYVAFAQGWLRMYMASCLVMGILIDFSPVLFMQYFSWLAPLVILAVADSELGRRVARPVPVLRAQAGPVSAPRAELKTLRPRWHHVTRRRT
jgi:hypothetical protein